MGASCHTVVARVRSSVGYSWSVFTVQVVWMCPDQATMFEDKREGGVVWETTD